MEKDADYFIAKYNGYRRKMVDDILRDVEVLGDRSERPDHVNITRSELAVILNKHL